MTDYEVDCVLKALHFTWLVGLVIGMWLHIRKHAKKRRRMDKVNDVLRRLGRFKEARMTLINNKEHFKEAVAFAKKLGGDSKRSFLYCINKINRIKKNCEIDELYLFQDFVKHSFCWAMYKNRKLYMNGKMILHGFQETFSVELDPEKYPYWSIHTWSIHT